MQHTSLVRAAFYNNDGVQHMNKGCFVDAVAAFTLALEILKPVSGTTTMGEQVHNVGNATATDNQAPVIRPQHVCMESEPQSLPGVSDILMGDEDDIATPVSSTAKETTTRRTENTNYIFRDPIDIPVQSVVRSRATEKMVSKLSIVVMYNLGLSFHLSALEIGCLDRLMRARMLYEFAFEMHMEEGCDVTLLYTLALMNNLGLIYHLLGEAQRSRHCFQNMLSTMMFLLEADDARKIKQWDGLLSNVMAYVFIDSKVSAPAA